jgi:hypothetical protein
VPSDQVGAFIPWDAKALEPIFAQLIPAAESFDVKGIADRAEKAHLPKELRAKIEADARWNPVARKGLEIACPQVSAKWLNYFGISAENAPEIVLITALTSIGVARLMLLRRIDRLIAVQAAAAAPPVVNGATSAPPAPDRK